MKICPLGVEYFRAERLEVNEGTDGQAVVTKFRFALKIRESAYKINSVLNTKM